MTSYPSRVGVMGLSSTCWLPSGSDMERGQVEYTTEFSWVPFILACVTGLWSGGVRLRPLLSMQRDWRWEPNPLPWSSPTDLVIGEEDSELLETLPSDDARWGRLSLLLPPDRTLSKGTGTGTKGDAIFLSCELLPRHRSSQQCFTPTPWQTASVVLCDDGV